MAAASRAKRRVCSDRALRDHSEDALLVELADVVAEHDLRCAANVHWDDVLEHVEKMCESKRVLRCSAKGCVNSAREGRLRVVLLACAPLDALRRRDALAVTYQPIGIAVVGGERVRGSKLGRGPDGHLKGKYLCEYREQGVYVVMLSADH